MGESFSRERAAFRQLLRGMSKIYTRLSGLKSDWSAEVSIPYELGGIEVGCERQKIVKMKVMVREIVPVSNSHHSGDIILTIVECRTLGLSHFETVAGIWRV